MYIFYNEQHLNPILIQYWCVEGLIGLAISASLSILTFYLKVSGFKAVQLVSLGFTSLQWVFYKVKLVCYEYWITAIMQNWHTRHYSWQFLVLDTLQCHSTHTTYLQEKMFWTTNSLLSSKNKPLFFSYDPGWDWGTNPSSSGSDDVKRW